MCAKSDEYELSTMSMRPNLIEDYRHLVSSAVNRLKNRPSTVAVVLLGGLGKRQYVDEFSDLDIAVFTDDVDKQLPPFSFFVHHKNRDIEFNITQHIISTQYYDWESEKREAYRSSIVVYDPTGALRALIDMQLLKAHTAFKNNTISALNQVYWKGLRHSIAAAKRGIPESAHSLLNESISHLMDATYAINTRELPHGKWRFALLEQLPCTVPSLRERFASALVVRGFDAADIERRVAIVFELFKDLTSLANSVFPEFPKDLYEYWAKFISGRQILSETEVDTMCDLIADNFAEHESKTLRGAFAMALLAAPARTSSFWDTVRADAFAQRDDLLSAERRIQTLTFNTSSQMEDPR